MMKKSGSYNRSLNNADVIFHPHFIYFTIVDFANFCIELFDEMHCSVVQRSYFVAKSLKTNFFLLDAVIIALYAKVSHPAQRESLSDMNRENDPWRDICG